MSKIDDAFIEELRIDFCREGIELLQSVEGLLLEMEKSSSTEKLNNLKRYLHSLKGNARAVGFESISKVIHDMEEQCSGSPPPDIIDHMLKRRDQIMALLNHFIETKQIDEILNFS